MGNHRCFVPGCHRKGSANRRTSFPYKSTKLMLTWLNNVKNPCCIGKSYKQIRKFTLCMKHFEEKYIVPRWYLWCNNKAVTPDAVPTLELPTDTGDWNVQFVENEKGEQVIKNCHKEGDSPNYNVSVFVFDKKPNRPFIPKPYVEKPEDYNTNDEQPPENPAYEVVVDNENQTKTNDETVYIKIIPEKELQQTAIKEELMTTDLQPLKVHNYALSIEDIDKDVEDSIIVNVVKNEPEDNPVDFMVVDENEEDMKVNKQSQILSSICHVCTEVSPNLRDINDTCDGLSYKNRLSLSFPDLESTTFDVLDLICNDCCDNLFLVYKFRQSCLENCEKLKQIKDMTDLTSSFGIELILPTKDTEDNETSDEIEYNDIMADNIFEETKPEIQKKEYEKIGTDGNVTIYKKTFGDFNSLKDHLNLKTVHKDEILQKERHVNCDICHLKFANMAVLWKHKRLKHKIKNIMCGVCKKKFGSFNQLKQHLYSHTKPFLCSFCPKRFKSKRIVQSHEQKHIGITTKQTCTKCDRKFKTDDELSQHLANGNDCEKKEPQYMCEVCGKMYRVKLALVEHLRTHTGAKPFSCPICGKDFRTRMQLMLHKEVHNDYKNYVCDECGKAFKTRRTFHVHKKIHSGLQPYECQFCERRFLYKKGLLVHTRTHTNERPFKCTYEDCLKDYSEKHQLNKHVIRDHVKEKNFKCEILGCGREFYFAKNLKCHLQKHDLLKFQCNSCDRMFKTRFAYMNHVIQIHRNPLQCCCKEIFVDKDQLVVHREICEISQALYCKSCDFEFETESENSEHQCEIFHCGVCDKRFGSQRTLSQHENTHAELAPVSCPVCERKLKNNHSLKRHLGTHSTEKPYSCDECGRQFRQRHSLRVHKFTHTGERLYKCDMCDKSYRQPTHLYEHKYMHLGIKPHKCEVCDKSYRQKRDLTLHLEKLHGIVVKKKYNVQQVDANEIVIEAEVLFE